MRKLIFDLDGTLWDTKDSYIYAYHKMVEEFHIYPVRPDSDILKYMGVRLDILTSDLFTGYGDLNELGMKAVYYSIEYVLKHPFFLSKDIYSLFSKLSKEYEIYIVSNCPRVYLDTFLSLSKVGEFVKGTYTITEGEKRDHLVDITRNYQDMAIFIGDGYEDYLSILDHSKIHFCYAKYGYIHVDDYDYSIDSLDESIEFLSKLNQKERMIDGLPYQVIRKNNTSITLMEAKDYTMLGFMEIEDYLDFRFVLEEAKKRTNKDILGPMNGKTWYSYRISIDHFDFKLYPDCLNDEKAVETFMEAGFKLHQSYSSSLAYINTKVWNRAKKVKLPKNITWKTFHDAECLAHIDELYPVAVGAFQEADYYRDISASDFRDIYMQGLKGLSFDLMLIYDDRKLIAFNFCYPDPEQRFYVCKTIGIDKKYRGRDIFLKLVDLSYSAMEERGFKQVLFHFQNDRTEVLEGIAKGYLIKRKHFGLLRYSHEE